MNVDYRAVGVGAAVQAAATGAYYASVTEMTVHVVAFGVVGGLTAGVVGRRFGGSWVNGTLAAVGGGLVFQVGVVLVGLYHAMEFQDPVFSHVWGQYISTAITYGILLLPTFALEGVVAGAVGGWIVQRAGST